MWTDIMKQELLLISCNAKKCHYRRVERTGRPLIYYILKLLDYVRRFSGCNIDLRWEWQILNWKIIWNAKYERLKETIWYYFSLLFFVINAFGRVYNKRVLENIPIDRRNCIPIDKRYCYRDFLVWCVGVDPPLNLRDIAPQFRHRFD